MPELMMERFRELAGQDDSIWMWVTIDHEGKTSNTLMTQEGVLNSIPEINPRFFPNFGVVELTIRQQNGTTVTLKKVR